MAQSCIALELAQHLAESSTRRDRDVTGSKHEDRIARALAHVYSA